MIDELSPCPDPVPGDRESADAIERYLESSVDFRASSTPATTRLTATKPRHARMNSPKERLRSSPNTKAKRHPTHKEVATCFARSMLHSCPSYYTASRPWAQPRRRERLKTSRRFGSRAELDGERMFRVLLDVLALRRWSCSPER